MAVCQVVVATFFNHNFVNFKATLILRLKIYEIKYNISLNDVHTYNEIDKRINVSKIANNISTIGDDSTAAG